MTHATRAEALSMITMLRIDMRKLTLNGPEDRSYSVPLLTDWAALPGRPGVRFLHVPHPDDTATPPSLYAAQFEITPGACYTGSVILQARLVLLARGCLVCNDQLYGPGQSIWLAPEAPTTWHSVGGCSGSVFYNAPKPSPLR